MKERANFYRCELCGNLVGLIHNGGGTLVCCGQNMTKLVPGSTDAAVEKHVPVVEKKGNTVHVTVGSVPHPMTEEHLIEWIALETPTHMQRVILSPGDKPEADFIVDSDEMEVFAYCNLHGLWKA